MEFVISIGVMRLIFNAGTALLLLERYGELAYEKEDSGLTTLQVLANMPSAFKSQTQMGIFQKFIYLRKSLLTLSLTSRLILAQILG